MKKQPTNHESEAEKPSGSRRKTTPVAGGEKESAETQEEQLSKVAVAIDHAIENIREKLTADDLKASVGDLVRLIQLRKELIDDGPKQVTVRWIEEWNNSPANDE